MYLQVLQKKVKDKINRTLEDLFSRRKLLRNKTHELSKNELSEVEAELAERCTENNYKKIKEEITNIKCDEGGINSEHLWKLKKKLSPKCRDPHTAMLDSQGNLITSEDAIESLAVETYQNRLKNR